MRTRKEEKEEEERIMRMMDELIMTLSWMK
jgi:hypothetical protein